MKIELRLFADLRGYMPAKELPCVVEVKDGATVSEVLTSIGVPKDKPQIILINGIHGQGDTVLTSGAVLSVFPPVAGG